MLGHTNIQTQSTGTAKFRASAQTGDKWGFQTLHSLKLELRPDPKSTKSLFTGSRCQASMYWKKN